MEHVIQIQTGSGKGEVGTVLQTELVSKQALYGGTGKMIRGTDVAIVTFADTLALTRDLNSPTDKVLYHLCRHDEGQGACSVTAK